MLLVANKPIQNNANNLKMTETLAYGYSSESTQRELSNEYQHEKGLYVLQQSFSFLFWMITASELEELIQVTIANAN